MLALGCVVSLALVQIAVVSAHAAPAAKTSVEKATKLPVSARFHKTKAKEGTTYELKLKSKAKEPLTVQVTVYLSVVAHNADKARVEPPHVIAPKDTYTVSGLAALDKVVVAADGYAPLELVVK